MGIDVQLEDETGNVIESVGDPQSVLEGAVVNQSKSTCLQFIDPYGDAVFNQMQIPVLLGELKTALRQKLSREAEKHLQAVVALVERAQGQTHTYVRFVGD